MANNVTKIEDLIVPEVMADMISAKVEKKIEEKKLEKSDDNNGGISSEQFGKMNYHERAKLYRENPEQYAELSK